MLHKKHLLALLLSAVSTLTMAANLPDQVKVQKEVDTLIGKHVPIESITATPVAGLYEVVVGAQIFYSTQTSDYLMFGQMIDMTKKAPVSLTEPAEAKARLALLDKVDPKEMIIFKPKGKTESVLTVFMDIDCGYCRKLHHEVPQLNKAGIEVRYLAFPRTGVGSESYKKALAVWCADDPNKAMDDAMRGKSVDMKADCDKTSVMRDHLQLVDDFGLQATPVLILADGRLLPGYYPAAQLIALMK